MTIKEFFDKYNTKFIDYDGYYGAQCMDLYREYVKEILDVPQSPPVVGAADVWTTYLPDHYDRIDNTPDGVPQLGDVVIWNKNAGGGFGHIAIFDHGDVNSFTSFDQNWPVNSPCHFQPHNYTNVLGWLRAEKVIIQPTPEPWTPQTKIPLGEPWGEMELQAVISTLNDQSRDLTEAQERIKRLEEEKAVIQKSENELANKLAECQGGKVFTKSFSAFLYKLALSIEKAA